MKLIDNKEHKEIMLNILLQVDRFCKENQIQYFLDSGTLLGAIRHKGFIPWDDDMDICMTRPNYDLFLEKVKEKKIADYIDLYTPEEGLFPYIKICDNRTELVEYPDTLRLKMGVYIDVFPKEGHPDDEKTAQRHCRKAMFYTYFYWFIKYSIPVWKSGENWLKKIMAYISSPFFSNGIWPLKKLDKIVRKYEYKNTKYTSSILAGGIRGRVPASCFASPVYSEFEGHQFPIPVGYDEYLKKLYEDINGGDYMMLPPEHQKVVHKNEIYWK